MGERGVTSSALIGAGSDTAVVRFVEGVRCGRAVTAPLDGPVLRPFRSRHSGDCSRSTTSSMGPEPTTLEARCRAPWRITPCSSPGYPAVQPPCGQSFSNCLLNEGMSTRSTLPSLQSRPQAPTLSTASCSHITPPLAAIEKNDSALYTEFAASTPTRSAGRSPASRRPRASRQERSVRTPGEGKPPVVPDQSFLLRIARCSAGSNLQSFALLPS